MADLAAMLHPFTCFGNGTTFHRILPDGPACIRAAAAIAPRLTPTPDDVRETLRANLFDGDEGGTVTMPIAHLLDEIVGVLMESTYLGAPRLTPDREALARVLRFLDAWPTSGVHPDDIYGLWVNKEDEPRVLRKSDILAALAASQPVPTEPERCPRCGRVASHDHDVPGWVPTEPKEADRG